MSNKRGLEGEMKLTSYEEIFGEEDTKEEIEEDFGQNTQKIEGQVVELALEDLVPFERHPFKVLDDEKMEETVESIRENGVLDPIMVRHAKYIKDKSKYEIISGHRRCHASKLAGKETIPANIKECTNDEAIVALVDEKKLGVGQGIDLSFLTEEEQKSVCVYLLGKRKPISLQQSAMLKELSKNGALTSYQIMQILSEEEKSAVPRKVLFNAKKLESYSTPDTSNDDIEKLIIKLLEEWKGKEGEYEWNSIITIIITDWRVSSSPFLHTEDSEKLCIIKSRRTAGGTIWQYT